LHRFFFVSCFADDLEYVREQLLSLLQKKEKDIVHISHVIATLMLLGKATANIIPDLENGERKSQYDRIVWPWPIPVT